MGELKKQKLIKKTRSKTRYISHSELDSGSVGLSLRGAKQRGNLIHSSSSRTKCDNQTSLSSRPKRRDLFFVMTALFAKFRIAYLSAMYFTHLWVRMMHDNKYQKGDWYKKYSDKKYTSNLHKATLTAFLASFIIFSLAQNIFPGLFNLSKPNSAFAGSSSVTWTTTSHFTNNGATGSNYTGATTTSQISTNGDGVLLKDGAPSPAPALFSDGADLVYTISNNSIYALRGANTSDFYKYSLSDNSWQSVGSIPGVIGYGGALVYPNGGDYIYATGGSAGTLFWRYSISGNSWSSLASTPVGESYGTSLLYPGTGDFIYAFLDSSGYFWRYSISSNSWSGLEALSSFGASTGYGASLVYPGSGDYIFATAGGGNTFKAYSISGNSWTLKTNIPATTGAGASLVYPGSGDLIFAFNGNSTSGFYAYSISGNSWQTKTNAPSYIRYGATLIYPNTDGYIYALAGDYRTYFWRYSITNNTWSTINPIDSKLGYGSSMTKGPDSDIIYVLKGGGEGFSKYSISSNSWSTLASTPLSVSYGGNIVYPGSGDFIYAVRGSNSNTFWRYSISGNSWTNMPAIPVIVNSGSAMSYIVNGDYIYLFSGNNTTNFLRFSIINNSWESMAPAPSTVSYGGSLLYPGTGDYIYSLRGNNSNNFWRYSILGNSWESKSAAPGVVYFGGSLVYPGSGNIIYARGGNGTSFWSYNTIDDIWTVQPTMMTNSNEGGNLLVNISINGLSYIYSMRGANWIDLNRFSISEGQWQINLPSYSSPGTITGLKINAQSVAKWSTISWNGSIPANTAIKFRTRGAGTEAGLSSATWSGHYISSGSVISSDLSQWLEIEMTLESTDGVSTPTLNDFTVTYDTLESPSNSNLILSKTDSTNLKDSSGNTITGGVPGAYTNSSTLRVTANSLTCTDCGTAPTNLRPEVEVKAIGSAFTGTGTVIATAPNTYVDIPNLTDGTSYHIQVRAVDDQGRVSGWTPYGANAESEADVSIDQVAPTGTVSINSNAQYATSTTVTLTNTASDTGGSNLSEMRFSNDGTTWSSWETYAISKSWSLSSGDGEKTVYAQFRDGAGNIINTYNEEFINDDFKDFGSTTANWDNTSGKIYLKNNLNVNFNLTSSNFLNYAGGSWSYNPSEVADLDNDGDLDIVLANSTIQYFRNDGNASSPSWNHISTDMVPGVNNTFTNIALGDLDGDSDYDLLIKQADAAIAYYRNDGTPTVYNFVLANSNFVTGYSRGDLSLVDLDADDDLDLTLSYGLGTSVLYFRNTGSVSVPSYTYIGVLLTLSNNTRGADFYDLDSDGDYDLLQCEYSVYKCHYFRNDGTPSNYSFTRAEDNVISIIGYPNPHFADFNNDGIAELIISSATDNSYINYYQNTSISQYDASSVAQTTKLNLGSSSPVSKVYFQDISTPNGQTVQYYLSSNGGTNWEGPVSAEQFYSLSNIGNDLRVKIALSTTNQAVTPYVDKISLYYFDADNSDSITLDTTPPTDLTNLKAYTSVTKSNELAQSTWYPVAEPYFEWDQNVDSDFNHYEYCFATSASCTPSVSTASANSVTINPAISFEGTHYFRVVAVDDAGQQSPTPQTFIYKYDATAPGAVTGLSASITELSRIKINWNAYSDGASPVERYKIERVKDTGNEYQIGDDWTIAPGYASFTVTTNSEVSDTLTGVTQNSVPVTLDAGLPIDASTKYQYRIRVKDISNPTYSIFNSVKVYGMTNDLRDPDPVTSVLSASCDGTTAVISGTTIPKCSNIANKGFEIAVTWTPTTDSGSGVAGYNIYRSTTAGVDSYVLIGSTDTLTNFYYDNDTTNTEEDNPLLNDYTTYYYRITAFDASVNINETDLIPVGSDNSTSAATPDVTAPSIPANVTASSLGLDSYPATILPEDPVTVPQEPIFHQKVQITWDASTDTKARSTAGANDGSGIKTDNGNIIGYRIYRSTALEGPYTNITSLDTLTCDLTTRVCYDEQLQSYPQYYYYKVDAIDNYNNTSQQSTADDVQTSRSNVPTTPTNVTVTTKTGNPNTDAEVGHLNTISFKGSLAKDCANNIGCLVKYELWRSTTNHQTTADWVNPSLSTKIHEFTPTITGDDRDSTYLHEDTALTDATTYYYKVRALDNTPAVPDGGPFYSPLSIIITGTLHAGWDTTADATEPEIPTDGLQVKVRDTHPNDVEYRNIVTWVMLTGDDVPERNGSSDFARYELHREVLDPDTNEILSDTKVSDVTDISENYYIDKMVLALGVLKYRYYITIVDNANTAFKYSNDTVINATANISEKQYASDAIIPDKAKPELVGGVSLSSVGVSTAQISWNTNQDADSLVQFREKNTNDAYVTIGQIERTITHSVRIFGLKPLTSYEYQIVSRNYLGNNIDYDENALPTLTTTGFYITHTPSTQVVTTTSVAEISWTTNLNASSAFVEYQLQRQPGDEAQSGGVTVTKENIEANPKSHRVVLKGLRSNRAYTYKIKSISTDGYLSEYPTGGGTNFETFRTKSFDSGQFTLAPSSSNVAERNITSTNAQIVWQTAMPSTTWVDYGTVSGVYDISAGNNDLTTNHVVVLDGLVPGTRYYYRVRVKDANEVEYTSQEYTFKAVLKPKISGLKISNVTPYTVTISWETNIETETLINWGKSAAYGEKKGTQGKSKTHEIIIEGLSDNTEYHYQILARDEAGDETADEDKVIRTPLDTEGPKIESVKTDILPLGENDSLAQVIISWKTNKPATTLVQYDEGVIGGRYSKSSIEDATLSTTHTVIIKDLNPSTTYHYRIIAKDKRENKTISNDYNFLTPSKEKSILQLILKSLEETFSWVGNVGQFFRNLGKKSR